MPTYAHSATFSETGDVTGTVSIPAGETLGYESVIAGGEELTGTIRVEESDWGDMGFVSVVEITDTETVTGTYVNQSDHKKYYRMHASSMVNSLTDDAVCSIGVGSTAVRGLSFSGGNIVDENGAAVATFTDSGASFPGSHNIAGNASISGTQVVYGKVTIDDDVDVTKTVTAGSATEYGFVHSTGMWDDLTFPAGALNDHPGIGTDPDVDTTTGLLLFDAAAQEDIAFQAQLPHRWKSGGTVDVHCHGMAVQATDPATAPTETQADGVISGGSGLLFNSALGSFSGLEGRFITTATASAQIVTVTDANNVILASSLGADASSVSYNVYLDTVRLSVGYKVLPANSGNWDQSTFTTVGVTVQLAIHDTNAVMNLLEIADIDLSAFQDSCVVIATFSRAAAHAQDVYTGDFVLGTIDMHFKSNTFGSLAEAGEDF